MSGWTGTVVESFGRRVVVRQQAGDGGRVQCSLRGKKLDVVVGDEVRVEQPGGADEWTVEARLPRRNVLARSDSRGLPESIVANVDQLAVVVAPRPACDPAMVDRYVAGAAFSGLDALLIVNKAELLAEAGTSADSVAASAAAELERLVGDWRRAGLQSFYVSARRRDGLDALIDGALRGRRTLLAGQSGVGKSSLLNALVGEDCRRTRALSDATGEGRHTSVSSAIFTAPWGGELADSPGVRDYAPQLVPTGQVQAGFREIAHAAAGCRFLDCLHLREPQCAVVAAVGTGTIDPRRYESYRRLLHLMRELAERRGPRR